MKPRSTLALFLATLVLSALIWWSDREAAGYLSAGDTGKALFRLEPAAIGRLVIKRPEGDASLEKRGGYWHLLSPLEDRAAPAAMDALLDMLGHLTVLDTISTRDMGTSAELSPEALGLDAEQVVRVELGPAAAAPDEEPPPPSRVILLGNPAPPANSLYVRVPDDSARPHVYVVDGNPRRYLDDPVAALRDRQLFLAPPDQIVEITLRSASGEIELHRAPEARESDWNLARPFETRADPEQVSQLLAELSSLRVESIIDSGEYPGELPRPLPPGSLAVELKRDGSDTPLSLFLRPVRRPPGEPEDPAGPLIEARVSDRPAVFQVRSDFLQRLPDSPRAFRDPRLARVPLQAVFGVGIESRGNPPVVLRTARTPDGVRWFSERNGVAETANAYQIASLIQAINDEKVLDFVSDSPADLARYNLSPPAAQVTLHYYEVVPETAPDGSPAGSAGEMGAASMTLMLGHTESGSEDQPVHRLYAAIAGEPFIYEISPAFREKAPVHPLKWKDLRVISFNPIGLRRIVRVAGGEDRLELDYDYRRDAWDAADRDGDARERVNREAVRTLRDTLGSLAANRWLSPSPHAFQALETPDLILEVTLVTIDRATGTPVEATRDIRLAKATELNYYGQIDGSPDLFEIGRDTFRDLVAPVLVHRVTPPPADF